MHWKMRRPDDAGQAAVESAIILPLMVFMLLGIVQLTMMHHARIMVEYAAFNACRAGIVHNMDKNMMTRAALISLMPTFGATDTLGGETDARLGRRPGIVETWAKLRILTAASAKLSQVFSGLGGGAAGQLDLIKVTVLHPKRADFDRQEEIHFDDIKVRDANHSRRVRNATRLTVRVRYLYCMRIPFANWIIHMAWLASEAGVVLTGPIDRPAIDMGGFKLEGAGRTAMIGAQVEDQTRPFEEEDRTRLFQLLYLLARFPQKDLPKYFIPIYSTYTMRMQSNPFRDNADL